MNMLTHEYTHEQEHKQKLSMKSLDRSRSDAYKKLTHTYICIYIYTLMYMCGQNQKQKQTITQNKKLGKQWRKEWWLPAEEHSRRPARKATLSGDGRGEEIEKLTYARSETTRRAPRLHHGSLAVQVLRSPALLLQLLVLVLVLLARWLAEIFQV